MRISRRTALFWWTGGLIAFAIVVAISLPLAVDGVAGGITDHQGAATAERVDAIHEAWRAAGVLDLARWAMIGDLIFIAIYSAGAILAGLYYRSVARPVVRTLGNVALIAGALFLITDMTETVLQLYQLITMRGNDGLAMTAALCGPPKIASFIVSAIAVLAALIVDRRDLA